MRSDAPTVDWMRHRSTSRRSRSEAMPTSLETAIRRYLRARNLSSGSRDSYFTTLRKWNEWGGDVPLEELRRQEIRDFLDWVYERAVEHEGSNPGRTANESRENLRAVMSWAWEQDV